MVTAKTIEAFQRVITVQVEFNSLNEKELSKFDVSLLEDVITEGLTDSDVCDMFSKVKILTDE